MEIKIKEKKSKQRREKETRKSIKSKIKTLQSIPLSLRKITIKKLAEFSLLILIACLPLFFGFGNIGNPDFAKQAFLVCFSVIALALWFFSTLSQSETDINFSFLHIASFVFILSLAVSALFSVWRWGSFWGWPQEVKESFLTYFSLFVFFFVLSHLFSSKKIILSKKIVVISGGIAAVIGILQLFGKFVLPFSFTKDTAFNTIGSVNRWALFLAGLLPLALSLFLTEKRKALKAIFLVLILLFSLSLIFAGFDVAWFVLLIGMITYITFLFWRGENKKRLFLLVPTLLLCLALAFGVLKIRLPNLPTTPIEVSPSLQSTLNISFQMLKGSLKQWVLGWGPGTFKYGWSKFKGADLNQTIFWNTRFTRGGSEITEMLGTFGLLGSAFALALFLLALWAGTSMLLKGKSKSESEWLLSVGIVSAFIALSVAKFLTTFNLTAEFLWWFLLASIAALAMPRVKKFNLTAESQVNFVFSFLGIIILTGGIFFLYLEGTRYVAEIKHNQAWLTTNIAEMESKITQAINLNPEQEVFWRNLADFYIFRANQEIALGKGETEEATKDISQFVANAVGAARKTTEINPNNVANWQTRGQIYAQMIGWSTGAFDWAVASYEKALDLEPNNPYLLVELGRTYIAQARLTEDKQEQDRLLSQAEENIVTALQNKPDYAPAAYQMAAIYNLQGKIDETIAVLESIKRASSLITDYDPMSDVQLAFQLGVLYLNQNQLEKAQVELERAVALSPTYSNARYFLGLIYDKQGQKNKAIEQFERISKLNPDNQEVAGILANLKSGQPIQAGETPQELPIKETPEEK